MIVIEGSLEKMAYWREMGGTPSCNSEEAMGSADSAYNAVLCFQFFFLLPFL